MMRRFQATAAPALIALMALGGCGTQTTQPDASSVRTTSLSASEVARLTGPTPGVPFDDAAVAEAWQQKWGVDDIGAVSSAIKAAADERPQVDGGRSYDDQTLTFTQWIVETTGADEARTRIREVFDEVARDSNLRLTFEVAARSSHGVRITSSRLAHAYRTDPAWPSGVPLTGMGDPATGTFRIDAGERADDADVVAYFDRHWPGQVTLSNDEPAPLE